MYVTGLVRASNLVRKRLQHGLEAREVESFQRQVQRTVQQVEKLCSQNGVTPGALYSPSRNAYKFLKNLDLRNLPVRDPGPPPANATCAAVPLKTAPPRISLTNVVRSTERFHQILWRDLDEHLSDSVLRGVTREMLEIYARDLEDLCQKKDTTTGALAQPSRLAYAWMKFVSEEQNFDAHLAALARAREGLSTSGLKAAVQLTNMRSIWRYNREGDTYLFKVHEGFLHAPPEVWTSLLKLRVGDCRSDNARVREYAHSEPFCEVTFALESMIEEAHPRAKGRIHDLDSSFQRVNQEYFGGTMKKPVLTWNNVITARKFGHYDGMRDSIMISISLDQESVPEFVVDSVMHHELLHKKHGTMFVQGKRISHSPEFRKDERLFLHYGEAERIISAIARRNRAKR
ncbi:MAG: hypothetical protein K2W95_12550 [Candidatus Obscuribacterales bacterium]|nr:hypothetical protein [Candidatus Obscuribacterales bacterium]